MEQSKKRGFDEFRLGTTTCVGALSESVALFELVIGGLWLLCEKAEAYGSAQPAG